MGTKKEKTKQVALRLPVSLHDYIKRRAKRLHGGDFTAAVIELLSWAREIMVKRDGLMAEKELSEWAREREAQRGAAGAGQRKMSSDSHGSG